MTKEGDRVIWHSPINYCDNTV